jgi:ketosteroid isomerase-like protein
MSQENVDAGQAFIEAVNRGDVDAAVQLCHPALVFEPLRAATEGAFLGRDGIRQFLADTSATFELFRVDVTRSA